MYVVYPKIPEAHLAYSRDYWYGEMKKWCDESEIKYYFVEAEYYSGDQVYDPNFKFFNEADAAQFTARWIGYDFGLPWFPV